MEKKGLWEGGATAKSSGYVSVSSKSLTASKCYEESHCVFVVVKKLPPLITACYRRQWGVRMCADVSGIADKVEQIKPLTRGGD